MTKFSFYKWPFILFVTGLLIRFLGMLLKIRHWPMADEFLLAGLLVSAAGIVYAIIKVLLVKDQQ